MLHPSRALQTQSHFSRAKRHIARFLPCPVNSTGWSERSMLQQAPSTTVASVQQQQLDPGLSQDDDPIVQWVVLRRDLWTDIGWPLGPVIAQACHASIAAMVTCMNDPVTHEYIAAENLDHMHKVGP
eukprot:GHRR01009449.1.p1 GENE.GHRR01009449.1~~GHRR01009449.1.p1  ORF type:complete len:127 (+),score=2.53 GHRR01009449.1:204-584(+)